MKSEQNYSGILSRTPLTVGADGQLFFVARKGLRNGGGENAVKRYTKKFPRLYALVRFLTSPVLQWFSYSARAFVDSFGTDAHVVSIGSGNTRLSENIINLDIASFDTVDIVASADNLPFRDGVLDGIVAEVLLEHVDDPEGVVGEFHRVLKPGGLVYITAPFLYPFHAVPGDYNRWTASGLKRLFGDFRCERLDVYAGAVTNCVLSLAYALALPFSLISTTLYEYAAYAVMVLLLPLKFLDPLFRKLPGSHYAASVFVAVFEKDA